MQAVGRDTDAGRRADHAALEAVVRGVPAPVPVAAPEEGEKRRQGRCGLLLMPKSRAGAKCAVLICLGLLGMDQAGLDASAAIAAIAAMVLAFFSCLIELQCFGKAKPIASVLHAASNPERRLKS